MNELKRDENKEKKIYSKHDPQCRSRMNHDFMDC